MPAKVSTVSTKTNAASPTVRQSKGRRELNGVLTEAPNAITKVAVRGIGNGKAKAATLAELPLKKAKNKVEKYTYKMPRLEHDFVVALKEKLNEQGIEVKTSELIRAGIQLLAGLSDARMKASLQKMFRVQVVAKKRLK